jgi:hypothetical protein
VNEDGSVCRAAVAEGLPTGAVPAHTTRRTTRDVLVVHPTG